MERRGIEFKYWEWLSPGTPFKERWLRIETTLRRQLPKLRDGTGLFAKDDISAAAVVSVCDKIGRRVPQELAVMGCNNDPAFAYTTAPSLTSVAYPGAEIGRAAAATLDRMLKDPGWATTEPELIPSTGIEERQSTAVLGYEDELVCEVRSWLQAHGDGQPLKVGELARRLAVAEPTLRRRFRKATGQTVKSAIDEHRLKKIQLALNDRRRTVSSVAYQFGFPTPEEMSRFVKRCSGESPTSWRLNNLSG